MAYDCLFEDLLDLAKNGIVGAQYDVGFCCEYGYGVRRNLKKAARWYKRAAKKGLAAAQFKLGYFCSEGIGLEQDFKEAAKWFRLAAEETYNRQAREKGLERRYEDLAPSTRLKYYHQAQKQYEKETGKPAYSQVKGDISFKEYFESQPESFKRSWLGPKRYELYSQGKYNPMSLGNPDTGYRVPVERL
ncbi:MAG: sel1 repeat family protein [Thermoguttaceae bacterium]|nr:sel1 repeat family protein [Thermoguttaceae bacterium]